MSTDLNLLSKGLKQLGFLVLLFIISPITLTIGFKALKQFAETEKIYIAYGIVVAGFLLVLLTIYFAIKTIRTILNALFSNN